MKSLISIVSLFIIAFIFFSSCNKTDNQEETIIIAKDATQITETSFMANWVISNTDIKKASIVLFEDPLSSTIRKDPISDPSSGSQLIKGLKGASEYTMHIEVELNDGTIKNSNTKIVTTSYVTENVIFKTSDGLDIAGKIGYLGSLKSKSPGILFMHELGVWVNNWKSSDVVRGLIAKGYVCMVIDFRGHGNSTPIDDIGMLIEDWSLVGRDLTASIEYLKSHEKVQSDKLALVGASLGAIMAVAGNGYEEVKTSVAVSGSSRGIYSLFPELKIKSAYYIAGENDVHPDVDFAEEAQYMYDHTEEPRKLTIKDGKSAHGTDLLIDESLVHEIIDWIHDQLKN